MVAPRLRVLFCGINPSLYTAWSGHHFGRPGNRFWPTLHRSGFTPRQLAPYEQNDLLTLGLGITNIAPRATVAAAELSRAELVAGARRLRDLTSAYEPAYVAVLGVTAHRTAFEQPKAVFGPQETRIGPAAVWVLPNPSGLNAHFTPARLADVFAELRAAVPPQPTGPILSLTAPTEAHAVDHVAGA